MLITIVVALLHLMFRTPVARTKLAPRFAPVIGQSSWPDCRHWIGASRRTYLVLLLLQLVLLLQLQLLLSRES